MPDSKHLFPPWFPQILVNMRNRSWWSPLRWPQFYLVQTHVPEVSAGYCSEGIVRPVATWGSQRARNGLGPPGQDSEPACANPGAAGQRAVRVQPDVHGQMFHELQLTCEYMVLWFQRIKKEKKRFRVTKPFEEFRTVFFCLLLLRLHYELPRNHDFTYYVLFSEHVVSILGLGRAESKLWVVIAIKGNKSCVNPEVLGKEMQGRRNCCLQCGDPARGWGLREHWVKIWAPTDDSFQPGIHKPHSPSYQVARERR